MLDTKSTLVLKILQKECKSGGYKIIEKNDIISALPSKFRCDFEELDNITNYLERQDLISIKYDDEDVYCLCILPTASELCQRDNQKKSPILFYFVIFFISLIGSVIGSIIGNLIGKIL